MNDRRPLYLLARRPIRVTYQAPALTVTAPDCADAFYPLPRVGRIVSRGAVEWSGDALSGCLHHGVPVVFIAEDGHLRGVLTPHRQPPADLSLHLDSAALAPEWPERYHNWYLSEERRMINRLAAALNWQLADSRAPTVRRRLDLALHQRWRRPPQDFLGELMAELRATVAESLVQGGVDAAMAAGICGGVNLTDALTRLAGWPLRGRVLIAGTRPPEHSVDALRYYQCYLAQPLAATAARLVRRLWRIPL